MIWVGWRRQRTETLIAAGILVALAAVLVPTGIEMAHAYHRDGLGACLGPTGSPACAQAIDAFGSRFDSLGSLVAWFTLIPGLVGVLLAAPFVLELEEGTYRFAWTQSITRRRWIVTKLGLAVATAVLVALAVTLLMTWWRTPFVHLNGRMDPSVFDSEGTVVFAYTLFALALATAVGVVWRRTAPALIVAFAGYFAARVFVDTWLRQRLVTPISATWRETGRQPANFAHAWVLSEGMSNRLGRISTSPVKSCVHATGDVQKMLDPKCLLGHGLGFHHAVYQPASRFWLLQGLETAIFGGVALTLIAVAAWWTHRRAA